MAKGTHKSVVAALGLLAACSSTPFDYDKASADEQRAWLDKISQGMAAGLDETLPRGAHGVYMKIADRKVDPARRRVDIRVDMEVDSPDPNYSGIHSDQLLRAVCPKYVRTDMEANKITLYVRFALPGGGTATAVSATPSACASFAKKP